MQRIPTHAAEVKIFTPDSLKDLPDAPTFTLKATSWREREDMEYQISEDGLARYSDGEVREIMVDELCRLWQRERTDPMVERVKAYWKAIDDHLEEVSNRQLEAQAAEDAGEDPPPEVAPFEHPDSAEINELLQRLTRASQTIREVGVSNMKYRRNYPRYTISFGVSKWSGLDTQPQYEGGVITLDAVVDMEAELKQKFGKEKGEEAYAELAIETLKRIYLVPDTEKNSNSPAQSQPTQAGSKENGQASPNGKSPESGSSDETLESSSTPAASN
jgi:hypothetical protein